MIVQQFNGCVTNTVVLSATEVAAAIVTTVAQTVATSAVTTTTIAITTATEVDSIARRNLHQQKRKQQQECVTALAETITSAL